ncbi:MAG: glycoside hydrolase family 13 protein [Chitinophagales bacterium]|nr:glycoside hydrolase family 13 protein [Bacteroidota bacterium]MBP7398336.1 glycoside hydrolase family 13 protein [Chitinophagales bacterium]MBK8487124.1 glycoside hydrolase family 13 protein [Bacteroidota bacterium]MBP8753493.1 glycoside hydrolase family 13 protein [Chitinophagales bacterium]MBP9548180.1 glycoside hydrolase family 13 protein [Chitinophagales bacterium]
MKCICNIFLLLISSSIFAQEVDVPEWAKSAVWYQIFPERFFNGDTLNDPTNADIIGAWPHDTSGEWQVQSWTSDWYEMQPWEKESGHDIWWNMQKRRYGGDIQGIIDKLGYLDQLGITAIYLNPVFWAPSLHKYDAIMYHHIDPTFGPDPEGDKLLIASEDPTNPKTWQWTSADKLMLQLIRECHQRNIKIIFDGVFNHLGVTSFAFQDLKLNQQQSKYKDWFIVNSWDDTIAGTTFQYEGWFGVPDLPEIKEDENGIVAGPKKYIFDCTARWMMPDGNRANGIDGWRLDVAFCVNHNFWKQWRLLVKAINPEAYLTAEVVDKIEVVKPYLEGDEFDAVMNYGFAVVASEFFINQEQRISVSEFDSLLAELRNAFPKDITYVQQNLFDSHDTQRFTSYIVNHDIARFRTWGDYFNKTKATNPDYNTRKPTVEEYAIQKLMVIFQMTYVGAPMIYYGDEVGMWGANDPDCRKPMLWSEKKYNDEVFNADGTKRIIPDKVEADVAMFNLYRTLIFIRKTYEALNTGNFESLILDDKKNVFAYKRNNDAQEIIVVLNNNADTKKIAIGEALNGNYKDVLNKGAEYTFTGKKDNIILPAFWGAILVKQ